MRPLRPRTCEDARQWASVELDGELTEFEQFLLQEHLRTCAECAEYADAIGTTAEEVRSTPLVALPAPVALPVRHRAFPLRAVSLASAAAAVAAAVGIGSLVGSVGHANHVISPRIARAAVTSRPGGVQGLIEQPKLAMLHAKVGIGKQRGLFVLDV